MSISVSPNTFAENATQPALRGDGQARAASRLAYGISRDSTVSLVAVRALIDVVNQAGGASAELMRVLGLRPEQLHLPEARVPRSTLYQLCERAIELTADPALGLHWAERITDSTFVPISQLVAHGPTLRHGFEAMAEFERLLGDDRSYEMHESNDTVTLRALPLSGASPRVQRFLAEMMVAGFYRLLRAFRASAQSARIMFQHEAPTYQAEYTRVFEAAVSFGQAFSGIVFDRALLDLPAPHEDPDMHQALRAVAERRLLGITQGTTSAQRVREFLVCKGGPHHTDMDEAARAIGLSVRSLRRRLNAEGNSYHEVANEALKLVAKHLLLSKQHTIQETAFEMGFADARSFHRAFRRWTGTTPGAYRRAQRQEALEGASLGG
jgi:AraC-like DNA-binding protein